LSLEPAKISDIQARGRNQYFKNERNFDTVIKNYFEGLMQRKKEVEGGGS